MNKLEGEQNLNWEEETLGDKDRRHSVKSNNKKFSYKNSKESIIRNSVSGLSKVMKDSKNIQESPEKVEFSNTSQIQKPSKKKPRRKRAQRNLKAKNKGKMRISRKSKKVEKYHQLRSPEGLERNEEDDRISFYSPEEYLIKNLKNLSSAEKLMFNVKIPEFCTTEFSDIQTQDLTNPQNTRLNTTRSHHTEQSIESFSKTHKKNIREKSKNPQRSPKKVQGKNQNQMIFIEDSCYDQFFFTGQNSKLGGTLMETFDFTDENMEFREKHDYQSRPKNQTQSIDTFYLSNKNSTEVPLFEESQQTHNFSIEKNFMEISRGAKVDENSLGKRLREFREKREKVQKA